MADYIPGTLSRIGIQTSENIRGVGQMRTMAELAAREFDQIPSQNAQYWAQEIRRDPEAAFQMAQQYGGFGNVQKALSSAYSGAQTAQRMNQAFDDAGFSDIERLTYELHGPEAVAKLRESFNLGPQGDRRIVEGADGFKYFADSGERVLPGVSKPADRREFVDDVLGRKVDPSTGEFAIPAEANLTIKPTELLKIRRSREAEFAPFQEAITRYEHFKATRSEAVDDFTLLQTLGKMLDPNSVVREGEAELMRTMGASSYDEAMRKLNGLTSRKGIMSPEARRAVEEAIERNYLANARAAVMMEDSWLRENSDFGFSEPERRRSLPKSSEMERFRSVVEEADRAEAVRNVPPIDRATFDQIAKQLSVSEGMSIEDIPNELVIDMYTAMMTGGL